MGLFDVFKNSVKNAVNSQVSHAANQAVNNAINGVVNGAKNVGKGKNRDEHFTFNAIPKNLEELKALPESKLDTAFKTTALVMITLMNYAENPEATHEMLTFLKGPEKFDTPEQAFLKERIGDKKYFMSSFFEGATVENNYTPTMPYKITVSENPYSFDEENWATIWVKSAGGDSPRPIKLRKKPSTGEWFLNDIQCLSEIRLPVADNPWA